MTEAEKKRLKSIRDRVRYVLSDFKWHSAFEMQEEIQEIWGVRHLDATITKRARELRDYGYTVKCEKFGPGLWKYRLIP